MRYSHTSIAAIIFFLFFCNEAYAENIRTPDTEVQAAINHYLKNEGKEEGVTGTAVTITYPENNKMTYKTFVGGVIGFPPYDKQSVTKDNLFEIGSITKSFAAAIILQLEAEGLLSINDKIGRWFPEYPNWKNVTIKQLLNMTSGIPSYSKNNEFLKIIYQNIKSEFTDKQLLNFANPNKPIVAKKNNTFDYSNTNYILAGLIVEQITKHSFAEELQKRLLNSPYALPNTYYVAGSDWQSIRKKIMPRMVHGYYYDDKSKKMIDITDSNLTWAGAAGAIVADTQDVATWVHVLYHGLKIPENFRKTGLNELESIVSMRSGKAIETTTQSDPKGFGLGVGNFYNEKEGRFWVYEGSGLGFRMMYFWRPCNDVIVVAALNNKAGEGDVSSKSGDHIMTLVMNVYQKMMDANPAMNCKN